MDTTDLTVETRQLDALYRAFNARDLDATLAGMHVDVEWPNGMEGGYVYEFTPEKPGDLGYWVGYRIAKAYYQRASDKRAALREILEMTDPKALLAKSGWHPGVELE